jgi:hypothetical protein
MLVKYSALLSFALLLGCQAPAPPAAAPTAAPARQGTSLAARVVAVGIPGAGAVSPVGRFHTGGPIHDKPEFAAYTQPGRPLDPERLLVASSSNFGAPRARQEQADGVALSIDPRSADPLVVPAGFATSGGQASALDGKVQLFTAQSPAFLNRLTKPGAVTADQPAIANPRGISINNAFGRIWFANTPLSMTDMGTESIIDPDGRPLADAPSDMAGGVFAGGLTNRPGQVVAGSLATGAVGNALLGRSPDGSTKAVFAVVTADGALLQAHAQKGVDGLAPAGTVQSMLGDGTYRTGVAFNWTPDRVLFVAEPAGNSIAALNLNDDGSVFRAELARRITANELSKPIDLAAAVPEVANPDFSSNTTMAGGSDLYVANRGNGTIARVRQDGKVLAVRTVQLPGEGNVGPDRLNGIAVSPDATRIWLTINGPVAGFTASPGALIEVPAFGAAGAP